MKTSILIAAAALAFSSFQPVRAQDAPQGDAVNGKRVFLAVGCMYSTDARGRAAR